MYKYIKMISRPLLFDSRKGQGKSVDFTTRFNPPLQLDISKSYEIALINSEIWYAWHNITDQNNRFLLTKWCNSKTITNTTRYRYLKLIWFLHDE